MINIIQTNQKSPGDIIEDVKKGKIHIVCMAQNGLTHLNVYAELYCKLEKTIVNQCVDLVNSKKETGTLFPKANISILPKSESPTEWNKDAQSLSNEQLRNCIEDVFVANEEYLKSEIIYFTLEPSYVNKTWALEIIEGIIKKRSHSTSIVETIWFER